MLGVFIAQLLFYTWCRVQCIQLGYEISQAAETNQSLRAAQNSYKIELARLKSPDRIAKIARFQLGLRTPGPDQIIVVP